MLRIHLLSREFDHFPLALYIQGGSFSESQRILSFMRKLLILFQVNVFVQAGPVVYVITYGDVL